MLTLSLSFNYDTEQFLNPPISRDQYCNQASVTLKKFKDCNILYKEYSDKIIIETIVNNLIYDKLNCEKEIIEKLKISA